MFEQIEKKRINNTDVFVDLLTLSRHVLKYGAPSSVFIHVENPGHQIRFTDPHITSYLTKRRKKQNKARNSEPDIYVQQCDHVQT